MFSTVLFSLPLAASAASSHPGVRRLREGSFEPRRVQDVLAKDARATVPKHAAVAGENRTIVVGTYNASLLTLSFSPSTGSLSLASVQSTSASGWNDTAPSWLQPAPTHPGLAYAGDESAAGQAILFNTSTLAPVSFGETEGDGPAYIGTTDDGAWVAAPNYADGDILFLPLDQGTGAFAAANQSLVHFSGSGPDATQTAPQPHMALQAPFGHVFVPDRGTDHVHEFALNNGTWELVQNITITPAGSGPRHMRFNTDGSVAYLLCEITSALHVFNVDSSGATSKWTQVSATSILPPNATAISSAYPLAAAEILLTKDGSAIYASNRDDANPDGDAIALFTLTPPCGTTLSEPSFFRSGGSHIRGMELSDDEAYLVAGNMLSGSVAMFARNATDGTLDRVALLETEGHYETTSFVWV